MAGFSIGGLIPIISLNLESRGVAPWLIGVNTAMPSLGVLFVAPFLPYLLKCLGTINALLAGTFIVFCTFILLPFLPSILIWFVLRFIFGIGLGIIWIISEAWLNTVAQSHNRGKIMGAYVTILASGFAIGPLVPAFFGYEDIVPFLICSVVLLFGIAPLIVARSAAPNLTLKNKNPNKLNLLFKTPTIVAAALIAGLLDSTTFAFLPIWGLHHSMSDTSAITMLTILITGNVVFQVPIGWLADNFNKRGILAICAILSIAAPPLILLFINQPIFQGIVLFVWGGAFWGIYTVGLVLLGENFRLQDLTIANTAFVSLVQIANLFGPPMAGISINLNDPDGLLWFFSLTTAIFFMFVLQRCT